MHSGKITAIQRLAKGLCAVTCVVSLSFTTLALSGCSQKNDPQQTVAATNNTLLPEKKADIVIRIGYENAKGEPFDIGMERWKEELEKISHGTMSLELYPNSSLGSKGQLLERMGRGEAVGTLADGGTFYGIGAYDLGITFGPYLFKNWDEATRLVSSKWYQSEIEKLAKDQGIRVLPATWTYGVRHILTNKPITKSSDFRGLTMRVTNNDVQKKTMEVFGAKTVTMDLTEVKAALRDGSVNGLENPLAHLYGGGYYQNAKYLLLSAHVYNFTNIVISDQFWQSLTPNQQDMLETSCKKASKFFNIVEAANEYTSLQQLKAAGVQITEPSPEMLTDLNNAAHSFYVLPDFTSKWTPGLYYKVLAAKAIPWNYYTSQRFKVKK